MRLGVLHKGLNPVLVGALDRISLRGISVDLIGEDRMTCTELTSLRPAHDLYYLKTTSALALSYAATLHHSGAPTLNPYPRVAEWTNKAAVLCVLRQAGLPVPETWVARRATSFAGQLLGGPLVLKPCHGSGGRGVRVADRVEDLAGCLDDGDLWLAQRHHPADGDGRDFKLYCLEDRVLGVRRAFRPNYNWSEKERASQPFQPDAAMRDLALSCGRILGLRLYGIDLVLSGGAPFVVDVNKCPGFIGVPGAKELLGDWLADAVRAAAG